MPLLKGLPKIAPDGYERHTAEAEPEPAEAPEPVTEELTDDDIPF
jgi:hypothetical protein